MTAYFLLQGQRGGCSKIRDEGVTKPYSYIFLILLWLSPTHRPPLCRARKKEGDDSDPPKKRGVMRPRVGVQCGTPFRVSQGVAIVGIYPCGKARKPNRSERRRLWCGCPLFPLPRMIPDRSSPSRVRSAASRPGPLAGRFEGMAVYEEKGGVRAVSGPKGSFRPSRSSGVKSPAGP